MEKAPEAGDANAVATGPAKSTPAMAAANDNEVSDEVFFGVVKSYNDRRGFGFLACAETAVQFGRDVYMPKAEATLAAAEASNADGEVPAVAPTAAPAAAPAVATTSGDPSNSTEKEKAEKPPPVPRLAEEDLVSFRVRLSIEGYPQAACVQRMRKFSGVVVRLPAEDTEEGDSDDSGLGAITCSEATEAHGIQEIPLRRESCGQIRLAVGDEVSFCIPETGEDSGATDGAGASPRLEAKLVFLSQTTRSNSSVLGCFTLDLPRSGSGEEVPPRRNLLLDCHAFSDKLILAGLPEDLEEKELMRFFSKQAATGAIVAHARACSFASVSFPSTVEVARFLSRTAHAFSDDKETRIAKLLLLNPSEDIARLPALPAPSLAVGEEVGSLLVVWSSLILAAAYAVELRPAGYGGPWATVDAASNRHGDTKNRFNSDCSSCKVAGLRTGVPYEARVLYFTECGTRSQASEASEPCLPLPANQVQSLDFTGLGTADRFRATEQSVLGPTADYTGYPPQNPAPVQAMPPAPAVWPGWVGAEGLQEGAGRPIPLMQDGFAPPLPGYIPPTSWRSVTGMVVPPPATPELRPADDFGFAVSIQWPAVLQAAAYVVELREAGSAAFERFVRSAPGAKLGTVVELRVGGLRPGPPPGRIYTAQVRTVAIDGSESLPSPLGWSPPLPAQPTAPGNSNAMPAATAKSTLSADAVPWEPYNTTDASVIPTMPAQENPCAVSVSSPPAPPVAPPPPQPPPSNLGNWAPPPWLGQPQSDGSVMGSLGVGPSPTPVGATSEPYAPGGPVYNVPTVPPMPPPQPPVNVTPGHLVEPNGVGDSATSAGEMTGTGPSWGAPGGPVPPPAVRVPLMQPWQHRPEPPPDISGHEECLILD